LLNTALAWLPDNTSPKTLTLIRGLGVSGPSWVYLVGIFWIFSSYLYVDKLIILLGTKSLFIQFFRFNLKSALSTPFSFLISTNSGGKTSSSYLSIGSTLDIKSFKASSVNCCSTSLSSPGLQPVVCTFFNTGILSTEDIVQAPPLLCCITPLNIEEIISL